MTFNKHDLNWNDDDSLESSFFWWDNEEETEDESGEDDKGESGDGDEECAEEEFELLKGTEIPGNSERGLSTDSQPTSAYSRFAQYGPGEEALKSNDRFSKIISTFVSRIPAMQGNNAQPYGIHGRKAAVAMIAYPHKILEQKKTRKADPLVYAVVDSHSSYYPDRGVFLNLFASTCEKIKIETWRAEKLTNNFKCEKLKKVFRGRMNKCDWAAKAGIEPGSTVVFVGDGCNGNVGNGYWSDEDLLQFKRLYNPVWVSRFVHGRNCGCQNTKQAEVAGWKMYHDIKDANDLKHARA